MSARLSLSALPVVAAALFAIACGGAQPGASNAAPPAVSSNVATTAGVAGEAPHQASPATVELWRSRCGQCHVRVEPGTRDRATLVPALERHKKRARLTESDVGELVDFLAK